MNITTGQYLKQVMKERKITQQELANKLGLGRSTIGMYVSDNATPSFEAWKMIIEALPLGEDERSTAMILYSEYMWKIKNEKRVAVDADFKKEYGSDMLSLVYKANKLTKDGLKRLLDRADELLEVPSYNEEYLDYQANMWKECEADRKDGIEDPPTV